MSDGPSDMARSERATYPRDLASLTAAAKERRLALEAAVRRSATLFGAARLVLAIAGPLAAGLPGAATAGEIAKVALEIAERETS